MAALVAQTSVSLWSSSIQKDLNLHVTEEVFNVQEDTVYSNTP